MERKAVMAGVVLLALGIVGTPIMFFQYEGSHAAQDSACSGSMSDPATYARCRDAEAWAGDVNALFAVVVVLGMVGLGVLAIGLIRHPAPLTQALRTPSSALEDSGRRVKRVKEMSECGNCKAPVPEDATICLACGAEFA